MSHLTSQKESPSMGTEVNQEPKVLNEFAFNMEPKLQELLQSSRLIYDQLCRIKADPPQDLDNSMPDPGKEARDFEDFLQDQYTVACQVAGMLNRITNKLNQII